VVRNLVKRVVQQCSTDTVLAAILYTVGKSIELIGDPKVMLKRVIKVAHKQPAKSKEVTDTAFIWKE